MKTIKLTFFANSTASGIELVDLLNYLFANQLIAGMQIDMKTIVEGDQADLMISALRDDVVIFDASVEDNIGSNYKAANMWLSGMEHILVVSRTRLPLNLQAFHEGGSPDTSGDISNRPFFLDNSYLVDWIKKQLALLEPQLPRPERERLDLEKGKFFSNHEAIRDVYGKILLDSIQKRQARQNATGKAFIGSMSPLQ